MPSLVDGVLGALAAVEGAGDIADDDRGMFLVFGVVAALLAGLAITLTIFYFASRARQANDPSPRYDVPTETRTPPP